MLNEADLNTLRSSALVMRDSRDSAAAAFYGNLFEKVPEVRSMFPDEISDQERKFAATLVVIVSSITNWDALKPVVEALARRHVTYGVKAEHYGIVGTILIETLHRLGASEKDITIWEKVYGFLSDHMIATAYPT
ncbi:MAG: globin domain-containing protein [Paracoccaceae bacterium]